MKNVQTPLSINRHLPPLCGGSMDLKKGEVLNKFGFTLVEIMIVTIAVGLIMTAMVGIMLSTFRSQNRTKASTMVSQNGASILSELRRNIFNSSSQKINCIDNTSIGITNISDNESTILSCENVGGVTQIASTSALHSAVLSGSEITVINCASFVSCETLPSLEISAVNFNFSLSSSIAGVGTTQDFSLKVTVRN